jgi:hypothetical protein
MCAVEDSAREKSAGQAGNLIEAKQRARTFAVVGTRVLTPKKKPHQNVAEENRRRPGSGSRRDSLGCLLPVAGPTYGTFLPIDPVAAHSLSRHETRPNPTSTRVSELYTPQAHQPLRAGVRLRHACERTHTGPRKYLFPSPDRTLTIFCRVERVRLLVPVLV